jgi:hypothetical protein
MVCDAAVDDLDALKGRFFQTLTHKVADGHDPVDRAEPCSHGPHLKH